jgi:hypothetical protein
MTILLETVIAGSKLIATGQFTGTSSNQILWQDPDGSYFLTLLSDTGNYQILQVALPAGYTVVGVDNGGIPNAITNTVLDPGQSELMLEDTAGDLAYGSFYSSPTGSGFAASPIGRIAPGWTVAATANYNTANYFGDGQNLLETVQNNVGTLVPFGSNLAAFTIPNGFTVVPNGAGNYLGSDLPQTLLYNAAGTVEALLEGGTVVTQGQPQAVAVAAVIGTLQPNETIVAVGALRGGTSTDILLQQGSTLYEWIINQGTIAQTVTLGLPAGFVVAGVEDATGTGTGGIVLTDAAGDVEIIAGTTADPPAGTPFPAGAPAVVLDGNYDVVSGYGVNKTLSDYLAELTTGVPLSATGARILTIQQGALSSCSYEQVVAGNLSLAAWEQNVATLDAIAAYCRADGITVQVETQLGWEGNFGAAQTYQWLNPALAADLPIGYVEDDQEFLNWTTLNIAAMAKSELQDIQIIHAALPDALLGEWEIPGAPDSAGTISAYHAFLQDWYTTLNADAALQGLPGISYVIADQYFSPILTGPSTVNETAQAPAGVDTPVNEVASLVKDAGAEGIQVEIQDPADATDLNPLQALARQELEISQEATLGIAAVQLSESFGRLPVSDAVNVPGATYNGAAEAAAITPLYQSRSITTSGAIGLVLPAQAIFSQGAVAGIAGLTVKAGSADQTNRLAVVLIDQTGTLSATPHNGATVAHDGANILILNGTPTDVAAELASLTIDEPVAGPDSIDVEVFGGSGRVAGGTIDVLATSADGSLTFTPNPAGVMPQIWVGASAIVNNGVIVSESFTWNGSDGLGASGFIGGTIIAPVNDILVDQPLLQGSLTAASYDAAALAWHPAGSWAVYDPLDPSATGTLAAEGTPVVVAASQMMFDPISGQLETETDTLAPVPPSAYASLPQFAATPYYFAGGGTAVTQYNTGDNPNWPKAANGLYAGGAGAIDLIASGPDLVIADGSTDTMDVGSIQTIYGIVNGATRVIEVRYLGTAANPYDEVDQIFNPYSATPQLWQQINTVGIPVAMAGTSPLPLPSAATVTEYNTGNNPNWSNTIWVGTNQSISTVGDQAEATTYESGYWDSAATIAATGVTGVYRGVSWIGEGTILNAYTLATPTIQGWTAGKTAIAGSGIAGDRVVLTGSDGTVLGGAQIAADGTWQVAPAAGANLPANYYITAQQFDLAGDSSGPSVPAPATYVAAVALADSIPTGMVTLGGPASRYIIADDAGSLYLQDTMSPQGGAQMLQTATLMAFTDGIGVFDPTGTAEDVARLYYVALDRAPDVAGLEAWTADIDDGPMSLAIVANDIASSPEFLQDYGASSNAEFVTQLYQNALGRAPDPAGFQAWNNALASGMSRGEVLVGFAESQEDKADTITTAGDVYNAEIYRLYETGLGRAPDPGGLAGWTAMLASGVTPVHIAQDIIGSAEFQQDYGQLNANDFVAQLYKNGLDRAPDPLGLQNWVNALQAGATAASVLVSIADSNESRALSAIPTHANWVFIPG